MKQLSNKLVKQKTKLNKDIGKIYYNTEINEEEIKETNNQIRTIQRAIRN